MNKYFPKTWWRSVFKKLRNKINHCYTIYKEPHRKHHINLWKNKQSRIKKINQKMNKKGNCEIFSTCFNSNTPNNTVWADIKQNGDILVDLVQTPRLKTTTHLFWIWNGEKNLKLYKLTIETKRFTITHSQWKNWPVLSNLTSYSVVDSAFFLEVHRVRKYFVFFCVNS